MPNLPVAAPDPAEVIREYLRDSMPPPSTERGVFPAADAHDALVALLSERQQDKERIERLRQAVVSIDYPYPIDIFPDLQERDEVFAAMRAVNRYATEQFASEIARQRGAAARTYLEDGDLPALAVEEEDK